MIKQFELISKERCLKAEILQSGSASLEAMEQSRVMGKEDAHFGVEQRTKK